MNDSHAIIESRRFDTRPVPLGRPIGWLIEGWRDFLRCPLPGLLHGAAVAVFGVLLCWRIPDQFWLLNGAFTGFLLVAPVVATGLYAISRALERGQQADLMTALRAWKPRDRRLVVFGLLLALAGTGWVMTSAALIWKFSPAPVSTPQDFLRVVVLAEQGWLFEAWLALGGLLAAPVFASSVVAIPMLLDREISVWGAVLTSWRVVMENPAPLALWGVAIAGFTLFGMATGLIGMLVVVPLLGHASWHAYRDLVRAH
ncbi:DUF2189 domain-containing protein [Methyloversatilis universalis]|uniref:DUF2189 domain-containing protein n=1 Tax=Methyloversatilis universalis TaxID=378211 RepID=UPI00037768E2|nr:DUF2189 domain-containing protein [Methyloversatilis universalis]